MTNDSAYVASFGSFERDTDYLPTCNRNKLTEMPALWGYAGDLFQAPGFGENTDFDQIKRHYHLVPTELNPSGIVPLGPDLSGWHTPHGRERL